MKYVMTLFAMATICSCSYWKRDNKSIKILTGPPDGYYHDYITKKIGKKQISNKEVEIINTPGSMFNLGFVSKSSANFALTQGDVISEISKTAKEQNIHGVAPLFKEHVVIFRIQSKGKSTVQEITQVNFSNNRLYAGSTGSGVFITAKRLMSLTGIDMRSAVNGTNVNAIVDMFDTMKWNEDIGEDKTREKVVDKADYSEEKREIPYLFMLQNLNHDLMMDIKDGKFDGYTVDDSGIRKQIVSTNDNIKNLYKRIGLNGGKDQGYSIEFLSLPSTIKGSMELLKGYHQEKLDLTGVNGIVNTYYIWAFIVTNAKESRERVKGLLNLVDVPLPEDNFNWPMPIHQAAVAYFSKKSEKVVPVWVKLKIDFFILLIICIASLALILAVPEKFLVTRFDNLNSVFEFLNKHRGGLSILLILSVVLLSALFIGEIEETTANQYNYISPFSDMTFGEIILWIFIFMISGTEQGIFPTAPGSKYILLSLDITIKFIVPLLIVVYLKNKFADLLSNKYGLKKEKFRDHIIIVGWDDNNIPLIRQMILAQPRVVIVILAQLNENPVLKFNLPVKNVGFVNMSPIEDGIHEQCRIKHVKTILIPGDPCNVSSQQNTLAITFVSYLRQLCKSGVLEKEPEIRIINPNKAFSPVYDEFGIDVVEIPSYSLMTNLFTGKGLWSLAESILESNFKTKSNFLEGTFDVNSIAFRKESFEEICANMFTPREKIHGIVDNISRIFSATSNTSLVETFLTIEKTMALNGHNIMGGKVITESGEEIPLITPKASAPREISPPAILTLYLVEGN